ncbi:hypothetical protein MASR2M48_19770 [Spirochaetota bacterium]
MGDSFEADDNSPAISAGEARAVIVSAPEGGSYAHADTVTDSITVNSIQGDLRTVMSALLNQL